MTQLSDETLAALADIFEAFPGMRQTSDRQRYLPIVAQDLSVTLDVNQTGERRGDVERTLLACSAHWGGIWALIEALGLFYEEADVMRLHAKVAQHLPDPVLSPGERADLIRLLDHAPLDGPWLRQAHRFAAPWVPASTRVPQSALEVAAELEDLSAGSDGPTCLLTFVAAIVQETGHQELTTWFNRVAARRGIKTDQREALLRLAESHLGARPPFAVGRQPAVFGGVPPRNVNFTGREQLLGELREHLAEGTTALVPCALHGHGGIGKTQVAVEYCYRYQNDYELVWWVPAEQETQLRASLVELGVRLQLPELEDQSRTVAAVLDALRRGEPFTRWLLVFDNASGPSDLREYFRYSTGHLLVTSRDRSWAGSDAATALEVDVLARDDSVHLLRRRVRAISAVDANRLADRVGDLPIALEQAAAYQLVFGVSIEDYLRLLDENPSAVLADGNAPGYEMSVEATFRVARDRLRVRSLAAAQLLELAAFFGAEPISRRVLLAGRNADLPEPLSTVVQDDLRLIQTVGEVVQLSLVRLDARRGTIQLHRLLKELIRASVGPDLRLAYRRWACEILSNFNPGDPDNARNWPAYAEMSAHIAASGCVDGETEKVRQVVLDQVRYLYVVGDYRGSSELAAPVLSDWRERLGVNAEETLVLARHLGNSLRALGRYHDSRRLNQETWERLRATYGDQSLHTMITANSLGADLRVAGEFRRAYELDRENVLRLRAIQGEDLSTIRATNNLSVDFRLLGRYADAEAQDRATIASCRTVLGVDHQQTYQTTVNLAFDLFGLGYYAGAVAELEGVIPMFERKVGGQHSNVLRANREYAAVLRKLGRNEDARLHLLRVIRIYRDMYTDGNIDAIAAIATLANTLLALGELHTARSRAEDAVGAYGTVLGPRHPFTLAASVNLGVILRAAGSEAAAARLGDESHQALREELGDRHPYTLAARAGLAADQHLAGNAAGSAALATEVYDGYLEIFGVQHPTTIEAAFNLGLYAAGEATMAQSIESLRRVVGDGHPNVRRAAEGRPIELDIEPPPI